MPNDVQCPNYLQTNKVASVTHSHNETELNSFNAITLEFNEPIWVDENSMAASLLMQNNIISVTGNSK